MMEEINSSKETSSHTYIKRTIVNLFDISSSNGRVEVWVHYVPPYNKKILSRKLAKIKSQIQFSV
jgi:hypothetical protein